MEWKKLTFEAKDYCRVRCPLQAEGGGAFEVGEAGALHILLSRGGSLRVPEGLFWPAGGILAFTGRLPLQAVGESSLLGVALAGRAAEDAAAALSAPRLLPPGAHPHAAGWLLQLAERPPEAEEAGLCFSLLAAVFAAKPAAAALPPLVGTALGEIHAHFADVYGVEELAEALGVSKGHLIRSFTAATGQSPGRYLTGVRLMAAKQLLREENYTLETVAGLCGFSGANYLCRVFKKEFGTSPAAFRRSHAAPPARSGAELAEWEAALFL